MNDKELNQLKYKNLRVLNILQKEFILRIDDNIIKPNTDDKKSNNGNNTKYSVEYNNKNHVRFIMTNKNNGNIISKNQLLRANFFHNNWNNKNDNYIDISNFNKILPYLQNNNKDLPDNKKDLFDLFSISHFIEYTKLTNKIIDKIIDNIDNIQ